jgi:hypothetical protein
MNDPGWVLDGEVEIRVTRSEDDRYTITDKESGMQVVISYSPEGRMLFDGEDIETEDYMGFVGLIEEVDNQLGEQPGTVEFDREW